MNAKLPKIVFGFVTNREDPNGDGRVKVRVPGVVEPESPEWAEPIGVPGGGSAKRGHYEPPAVNAIVAVFAKWGDPDRLVYLAGPWGRPGGVADVPTGAAVEGDDRQAAVTEDEAWRITRDSRTTGELFEILSKTVGLQLVLDADADKLFLGSDAATDALVKGTSYKSDESSMLSTMKSSLASAGSSLQTAGTDATFKAAFNTAALAIEAAGVSLSSAANAISANMTSSTAHLSDVVYTE